LKQFVEKFLEAFKQQQRSSKDKQSIDNTKQSDVVQEFFKKIYKYILTSATIKSHLEKLNAVVSVKEKNIGLSFYFYKFKLQYLRK